MPTLYRAGTPRAGGPRPENPDEFNRVASLKTGSRLHGGFCGLVRRPFSCLRRVGTITSPCQAFRSGRSRREPFTRWVTEGSISIPGELEKTMLQAIAGLLGGRVRVMVSPGLPVEINHIQPRRTERRLRIVWRYASALITERDPSSGARRASNWQTPRRRPGARAGRGAWVIDTHRPVT
jgi:hypothetical protein